MTSKETIIRIIKKNRLLRGEIKPGVKPKIFKVLREKPKRKPEDISLSERGMPFETLQGLTGNRVKKMLKKHR